MNTCSKQVYVQSMVELIGDDRMLYRHVHIRITAAVTTQVQLQLLASIGHRVSFIAAPKAWLEERCVGLDNTTHSQSIAATGNQHSHVKCRKNRRRATNFCRQEKSAQHRINCIRDPKHYLHHKKDPSKLDVVQNGTITREILLALFTCSSLSSFYFLERLHLFYLLYEICFLIIELFILRPVGVESRQKLDKFLAVPEKYFLNWTRFVGVCHKHLYIDTQQSVTVSYKSDKNHALCSNNTLSDLCKNVTFSIQQCAYSMLNTADCHKIHQLCHSGSTAQYPLTTQHSTSSSATVTS